jgi:hypothetical protein
VKTTSRGLPLGSSQQAPHCSFFFYFFFATTAQCSCPVPTVIMSGPSLITTEEEDDNNPFAPRIENGEWVAVMEMLQNPNLSSSIPSPLLHLPPAGMSPARFQYITLRLLQQQQSGGHGGYASVNAALGNEWVPYNDTDDLTTLMRDPSLFGSSPQDDTDDDEDSGGIPEQAAPPVDDTDTDAATVLVREIYRTTRTAAFDTDHFVSDSPTPMRAGGAIPARLLGDAQVELITYGSGPAHLIPPNAAAGSGHADTWLYVAAAALGLDPELHDSSVLLKALRGCWKSSQSTLPKTGLNRSPTNLLRMMDHHYVFGGVSTCVMILPIMTLDAAKAWDGVPYSVIILCDDDPHGRATFQQVAQRIGLTIATATAATTVELSDAISLLTHVLKFSASTLEYRPAPPSSSTNGGGTSLWEQYRDELEAARTLYTSITGGGMSRTDLLGKIVVPIPKDLTGTGKMIAKVDLGVMNHYHQQYTTTNATGRGGRGRGRATTPLVIYPDPILLAAKSSIVWTRKFAFQLLAETEPSQMGGMLNGGGNGGGNGAGHNAPLDAILGQDVAFGSQNDGSLESFGNFTG